MRILGVFVEGEDTYSPFWCIHEEVNGEITEYVFANDDTQRPCCIGVNFKIEICTRGCGCFLGWETH